jgi:diguanylate cyclase (GGDEF)-like protein/PAS domain S-box-containing protein
MNLDHRNDKVDTANIINENINSQSSDKTLNIDYLEHPIEHAFKNNDPALHYLYQQAPVGIILNIISALLVTWFILPTTPDYIYIPWLSFIVLTAFTHTLVIKDFGKHKKSLHLNNQWAIYQTMMVGISALTFSVGYLLFLPLASFFVQVILLLTLAILSVAYLPLLSVFLPAYIIYISTFIFPMIFWIYSMPPEEAYPTAALLAVTYCILVVTANYYSKSLLEAFGLAGKVNGKVDNLYGIIENTKNLNVNLYKDNHEYIRKNEVVSREKQQAEITLQSIGEGVISTDQFGRVVYMNPVAEIYTGWNANDIKGKHLSMVLNLVDESSHIKLSNPIEQCIESNATINSSDNSILIRRDGLEYAIEYSATPIKQDNNILTGSVMIFRDVTEKRSLEKNLNWQAKHDPLTGLINRREFDARLDKIISSPNNSDREHAVCYIDLDRFKLVNDSCGHEAGDVLLKKISDRLKKIARDTDTVARLGGDEFAVIMYSCNLDKAKLIAEIFRDEVFKTKFDWHGKNFTITASIGIVPLNDSTTSLTELKRVADLICYQAKDAGGNRIEILETGKSHFKKHTGELKILEELQKSLEKENFKLYTQQIKPLDDLNDILFYEVLLRMKNTEGELLPANSFLHTAEAYHMLSAIDDWVLKVVMEMIAYGNPLFNKAHMISINLSQQSVLNEKFIKYAVDTFSDYDIPAGNICFEINEPQFHDSMERFKRFVTLMKRQGCKIALDNFNYNPVSINIVKQLNIDYIKLDARQFSKISNEQNHEYKLLESINDINHLIGAQTIMKCIDSNDIVESSFEIGADFIQGYSIEPPQALVNS